MKKNQNFFLRLGFSFRGLARVALREKSFRTQLVMALLVFGIATVLRVDAVWWAFVFVAIGLVLVLEVVNTALEMLCDLVQPDYSEIIRDIKDMMAGAVLLASTTAASIGLLMLLTHREQLISLL